MKGIDVSKWQGTIDWAKVKADGIDFVIIRAGYSRYADPNFVRNYAGAKAAGLSVGAYWYSYALSTNDAAAEAAACIRTISGKQFEMPIYFDIEEKTQFALGKSFCSAAVKTFCTALEKAGYFAGIYSSRSALQTYISTEVRQLYTVWVAAWGNELRYDGAGMWQYTDSGNVAGIKGNVDRNISYKDFPTIIKNAGLNGFTTDSGSNESSKDAATENVTEVKTYVIQRGDTLSAIAKKYGTTVDKLVKLNSIKDKNKIYAGQTIKIP